MTFALLLAVALPFAESKPLAVQIAVDQAGISCNQIDGAWGEMSQRALEVFLANRRKNPAGPRPMTPDEAFDVFFAGRTNLFTTVTVTEKDVQSLVRIPADPAAKAKLDRLGYESLEEMLAERGHLSCIALEKLNPDVDWSKAGPGTKVIIPNFPPMEEELDVWPRNRPDAPKRPRATLVKVSLSRFEITAYDANGRLLALFPCSIAASKAKLPSRRELKIKTPVAGPNYTLTPDNQPAGRKPTRYILSAGPNSPVGVVWLGLDLASYGIHGTPYPQTIGRAESHGCFRLANWNAARLYGLCGAGTRVVIEE